jgi:hypothetical protein
MFNLTHEKKLSINHGKIYPFYLEEIIPGDRIKMSSEALMRYYPTMAPLMERIDMYMYYFFVPNRIIWNQWEEFITGGSNGSSEPIFPQWEINETTKQYFDAGGLPDYFGIPPVKQTDTIVTPTQINALPFRAYRKIWEEYFCNTNFGDVPKISDGAVDVNEIANFCFLHMKEWSRDYFTSSLPWSQRGGEVMIPYTNDPNPTIVNYAGSPSPAPNLTGLATDGGGVLKDAGSGSTLDLHNTDLEMSINDLRQANALQIWLEKNARAGYRYVEQLWSHFKVQSDDLRFMRPQYLGGGMQPVTMSEVLANFGNDVDMPLGQMAGHGLSIGNSSGFNQEFKEHGYVIGLLTTIPRKASYGQGIPRTFFKTNKFDFPFPEFANLGEQEVYTNEVWHDYLTPTKETWGYQSRYAEYKQKYGTYHADFREKLSFWHGGRIFSTKPALNTLFTSAGDTATMENRIFAVDDSGATNKMYMQVINKVKALRPLPIYGTPSL